VRLALGASRGLLMRPLLIESLMLSVGGAVLGLVLSFWTIRGLLSVLPADGLPLNLRAEPDPRILVFSLALALATGLIFGLAPVFQTWRVNLSGALKDAAGALTGAGGSVRLRKALVAAQVAFSFLLLAGAGLFVKTRSNLRNVTSGFREIDHLVTFQVDPSQLFSLSPADLPTALAALAVLATVSAGAGLLPARHASGIDPSQALRHE